MDGIIENLQKVGLTEYEAKVYLNLLQSNISSASLLARESGVPRTKIYTVLESLRRKGWVKIYSGSPLLFKAINPAEIFEKYKEDYGRLLNSIQEMLEVGKMEEKFVITNYNIGLENFKGILRKAKTVWISNTTEEFLEEIKDSFNEDAEIKVVLFPGERIKVEHRNVKAREAKVKIVQRVGNMEVPAISIILDEERVFNIFKSTDGYIISEMLYEECVNCFREWWNLGWSS
jgi:sugar-specific transcriptional regulator TrmB